MRKVTRFVFMSLATVLAVGSSVNAQICIPDPQYTSPGIYPDTATGFAQAIECVYYEQLLTMVVPTDTLGCTVDSVILTGLTGLPTGLTYGCSPTSCGFPGGTSGCALVYGTPVDTGSYPLTAVIVQYLTGGPICVALTGIPQNFDGYVVMVKSPISFTSTTPICGSVCDGSITALHPMLTAPITYQWSDPGTQTTQMATGLCSGNYTVTITDSAGCVSINSVSIMGPTALVLVTGSTDATCGNQDGSASVAVTGGTLSYTYSWDDPAFQTTDTAFGLGSGAYMVLVTDGNGCQDSANVSVSDLGAPTISLQSSSGVTCNGNCDGSAVVSATGGATPYTFTWDTSPLQTGTSATNLCGGNVNATVTDDLGCIAMLTVSIAEPSAVAISNEAVTEISCAGVADAAIDITAGGGSGSLNYSINGGTNYTGSGNFTGLGGGSYDVVVMDDSGCTDTGSTILINEPALLTVNTSSTVESVSGAGDGSAVASPSGGTPAYTYAWSTSPTQTTQTANGLNTGGYQVVVLDANGCSASDSVDVGVGVGIAEMINDIEVKLYPNPANDRITVEINYNENAVIEIIDLVGKQLFLEVMNNKITIDLNSLKEGLYLYRISTRDGMKIHQGKMSIVK